MKVAVFSDVHANYDALSVVLDSISNENVDKVVFLGDLLTYGCKVKETIDLLEKFSLKNDVVFVSGNHEDIYFNIQSYQPFEYKPFPDFIHESIEYTSNLLNFNLKSKFRWVNECIISGVVFSHANLNGYGDWSYVNSDDDIKNVVEGIYKRKCRGAVFGHTHRTKLYKISEGEIADCTSFNGCEVNENTVFIGNSGSIGQPRGTDPSFLILDIDSVIKVKVVNFNYDINSHVKTISNSTLSESTKAKLLSFYHGK